MAGAIEHLPAGLPHRSAQAGVSPWPWRRIAVALLIVPELIAFSHSPTAGALHRVPKGWLVGLLAGRRMLLASFVAAAIFSWDSLKDEILITLEDPLRDDANWRVWLGVHLGAVATLIAAGWFAVRMGAFVMPYAARWAAFGAALSGVALVGWAASVMPPAFWLRWVKHNPLAMAAAVIVGVVARLAQILSRHLWSALTGSTFYGVALLLRMIGQQVVVQPERAIVGTPRFSVQVAAACSGIEGIALVIVLTCAYLWFFRRELRFPQVLMLIPFGVAAIWMLNTVRIVALIMLGQWWPAASIEGFHSVAGWLFFNSTAFALIVASRRVPAFTRLDAAPARTRAGNLAAVYLAPLLAILAASMVTRIFAPGFDSLYPLRVVAAAAVLWTYRKELAALPINVSIEAIGLGAVAFVMWILLARGHDAAAQNAVFAAGMHQMPEVVAPVWLGFRIFGAVLTVPIAEELAFRGYLLRKLVSAEFEKVSYRHFTWISFLGSSALFAALHGQWLAGLIAGMSFAAAVYRRGRLCDAVVAHATANAMLAAWVLATHNWALWN
ncbi:MAG TPA: exosortase E/protease, VPEID-CTERM system [Candidatus Binataceae bacterium]